MTRYEFKELETILLGIEALVSKVKNAKENTPLSPSEAISLADDFAALKQRAFLWIKKYMTVNTSKEDKKLFQEIAAGLEKLKYVNTQFAPAEMKILIEKLRNF